MNNKFVPNISDDKTLHLKWIAHWYELDYPLEINKEDDYFIIPQENRFATALDNDKLITKLRGSIVSIFHPQIGFIKKIDTKGLVYKIYDLENAEYQVEAEQGPGEILWPENIKINEWIFDVELIQL
jgi:hypothetical protein